jgi:hypothetical protein
MANLGCLSVPAARRPRTLGSVSDAPGPDVRSVVACGEFRLPSRLPSSPSAARRRALFKTFLGTTQLSDFPDSCISGVRPQTSRCALHPPPGCQEKSGISRFSCEVFPCMRRVSDPVGSPSFSRFRPIGCGLPHRATASAPQSRYFRGSIPGLHVPLLTLRNPPFGWPRIARGRCGSLLLHRTTPSFATPRRLTRRYRPGPRVVKSTHLITSDPHPLGPTKWW